MFASPYERALIKRLESFAWIMQDAAERRAPHRIAGVRAGAGRRLPRLLQALPGHRRVAGRWRSSRLALCLVTKTVIFRCLDLLGVSAPESM